MPWLGRCAGRGTPRGSGRVQGEPDPLPEGNEDPGQLRHPSLLENRRDQVEEPAPEPVALHLVCRATARGHPTSPGVMLPVLLPEVADQAEEETYRFGG